MIDKWFSNAGSGGCGCEGLAGCRLRAAVLGGAQRRKNAAVLWKCQAASWMPQDTRTGASKIEKWWLILIVILPPINIDSKSSSYLETILPSSYLAGSRLIYWKVLVTSIFYVFPIFQSRMMISVDGVFAQHGSTTGLIASWRLVFDPETQRKKRSIQIQRHLFQLKLVQAESVYFKTILYWIVANSVHVWTELLI